MIESKRHGVAGLSPVPGGLVHNAGSRCAPPRKLPWLTISVEQIDLLLTDIQRQVEALQQQMTNLRLVRTQLPAAIAPSSVCSPTRDCVLMFQVARVAESHEQPVDSVVGATTDGAANVLDLELEPIVVYASADILSANRVTTP